MNLLFLLAIRCYSVVMGGGPEFAYSALKRDKADIHRLTGLPRRVSLINNQLCTLQPELRVESTLSFLVSLSHLFHVEVRI